MHQVPAARVSELRSRLYHLLESTSPNQVAKWVRLVIGLLILANVVAVVLESHSEVYAAYGSVLAIFNLVSVGVFTIEFALRIWVSADNPEFAGQNRWRARAAYLRGWGAIDFLAIAPFYLGALVTWDLRYLRALRLIRILKLSRNSRSLDVFFHVIRSQVPNLLGAALVILILLMISSTLMYSVESDAQPEKFGNISKAMWWSIVTLTSVGYGDVVPGTPFGKVLGGLIMFLGVGLVALPAAILAGSFANELQMRRERVTRVATEYLQDGHMNSKESSVLLKRGLQEGFTREEIEEIADNARKSVSSSQVCPKCGYSENEHDR
jgi:voltage-gated potassium channel